MIYLPPMQDARVKQWAVAPGNSLPWPLLYYLAETNRLTIEFRR